MGTKFVQNGIFRKQEIGKEVMMFLFKDCFRQVSHAFSGDSGGGLIAERFDGNFVLVGVGSFGESECGVQGSCPGVFTNVLSHASWIRKIIGGGRDERCTTEDGRICLFPFSYQGTHYTDCTVDDDPDGRKWCSTKVDSDGDHVQNQGQWGYCIDQCQRLESFSKEVNNKGKYKPGGTSVKLHFLL